GIRDFHVTGVQTCALPILWGSALRTWRRDPVYWNRNSMDWEKNRMRKWLYPLVVIALAFTLLPATPAVEAQGQPTVLAYFYGWRSEERRVGKECIYWW